MEEQPPVSPEKQSLFIRFLVWLKAKADDFVEEYEEENKIHGALTSAPAISNPAAGTITGIPGVVIKGLLILLVPAIKGYQEINYRINKDAKENAPKKPSWTRKEQIYFILDIALFALAVTALVFLHTVIGAIIGVVAAVASLAASIYQYAKYEYDRTELENEIDALSEFLKNLDEIKNPTETQLQEKTSKETQLKECKTRYRKLEEDSFTGVKRALNITFTGLYVAAAGLILAGLLLGPIGLPAIMAGVVIATTVSVISMVVYAIDFIKKRVEKNAARSPKTAAKQEHHALAKAPELDHDLEKIAAPTTSTTPAPAPSSPAASAPVEDQPPTSSPRPSRSSSSGRG